MHFGELSLINDCQGFRFNRLMSQKKKKEQERRKGMSMQYKVM